ncbi:hypothetical protein JCM21900_003505 [Sporobolomyces salmonicolor]
MAAPKHDSDFSQRPTAVQTDPSIGVQAAQVAHGSAGEQAHASPVQSPICLSSNSYVTLIPHSSTSPQSYGVPLNGHAAFPPLPFPASEYPLPPTVYASPNATAMAQQRPPLPPPPYPRLSQDFPVGTSATAEGVVQAPVAFFFAHTPFPVSLGSPQLLHLQHPAYPVFSPGLTPHYAHLQHHFPIITPFPPIPLRQLEAPSPIPPPLQPPMRFPVTSNSPLSSLPSSRSAASALASSTPPLQYPISSTTSSQRIENSPASQLHADAYAQSYAYAYSTYAPSPAHAQQQPSPSPPLQQPPSYPHTAQSSRSSFSLPAASGITAAPIPPPPSPSTPTCDVADCPFPIFCELSPCGCKLCRDHLGSVIRGVKAIDVDVTVEKGANEPTTARKKGKVFTCYACHAQSTMAGPTTTQIAKRQSAASSDRATIGLGLDPGPPEHALATPQEEKPPAFSIHYFSNGPRRRMNGPGVVNDGEGELALASPPPEEDGARPATPRLAHSPSITETQSIAPLSSEQQQQDKQPMLQLPPGWVARPPSPPYAYAFPQHATWTALYQTSPHMVGSSYAYEQIQQQSEDAKQPHDFAGGKGEGKGGMTFPISSEPTSPSNTTPTQEQHSQEEPSSRQHSSSTLPLIQHPSSCSAATALAPGVVSPSASGLSGLRRSPEPQTPSKLRSDSSTPPRQHQERRPSLSFGTILDDPSIVAVSRVPSSFTASPSQAPTTTSSSHISRESRSSSLSHGRGRGRGAFGRGLSSPFVQTASASYPPQTLGSHFIPSNSYRALEKLPPNVVPSPSDPILRPARTGVSPEMGRRRSTTEGVNLSATWLGKRGNASRVPGYDVQSRAEEMGLRGKWPIIKVENIPFYTTTSDILEWLPAGLLPSEEELIQPIHLILHRRTGRTLPHCYLEIASLNLASFLVEHMDRSRLGDRTVRVKWERPGELMRDLFAQDAYFQPGAGGFARSMAAAPLPLLPPEGFRLPKTLLVEEDLRRLIVLMQRPAMYKERPVERAYMSIVSIVSKFPWSRKDHWDEMLRDQLFDCTYKAAQQAAEWGEDDYLFAGIFRKLSLIASECSGFTPTQKSDLAFLGGRSIAVSPPHPRPEASTSRSPRSSSISISSAPHAPPPPLTPPPPPVTALQSKPQLSASSLISCTTYTYSPSSIYPPSPPLYRSGYQQHGRKGSRGERPSGGSSGGWSTGGAGGGCGPSAGGSRSRPVVSEGEAQTRSGSKTEGGFSSPLSCADDGGRTSRGPACPVAPVPHRSVSASPPRLSPLGQPSSGKPWSAPLLYYPDMPPTPPASPIALRGTDSSLGTPARGRGRGRDRGRGCKG